MGEGDMTPPPAQINTHTHTKIRHCCCCSVRLAKVGPWFWGDNPPPHPQRTSMNNEEVGRSVFVTTEAFWLGDERRRDQWSYRVWLLYREELQLRQLLVTS